MSSANVAAIEASTAKRRRSGKKSRIGEATGECAAVCCCCPCAVVHLLLLTVYRLPATIWRIKKKKKTINKLQSAAEDTGSRGGEIHLAENDAVRCDSEMWRQFYEGGFWRSDSRGDDDR